MNNPRIAFAANMERLKRYAEQGAGPVNLLKRQRPALWHSCYWPGTCFSQLSLKHACWQAVTELQVKNGCTGGL